MGFSRRSVGSRQESTVSLMRLRDLASQIETKRDRFRILTGSRRLGPKAAERGASKYLKDSGTVSAPTAIKCVGDPHHLHRLQIIVPIVTFTAPMVSTAMRMRSDLCLIRLSRLCVL